MAEDDGSTQCASADNSNANDSALSTLIGCMSVGGRAAESSHGEVRIISSYAETTHNQCVANDHMCTCPDISSLAQMLQRLAKSDARFMQQQRGEKELSASEKIAIGHSLLHTSPSSFVNKFGAFCNLDDLEYLRNFKGDYRMDYMLTKLSDAWKNHATQVKNRRYKAVHQLESEGYFEEEEMKRRDPLLYEQMVGRYLLEEEVKAEADRQLRDYRFSSWLMAQVESKGTSALYHWQLQQELQQTEETESDSDDEGCVTQDVSEWKQKRSAAASGDKQDLNDVERQAMREEFLHIMQERFLAGGDRDFDYRQVDNNEEYDDLELETEDAEARYFDEEEPDAATSQSGSENEAVGVAGVVTTMDYDY